MQYLLDTNICIYIFKGMFNLDKKLSEIGLSNFAISEITYAELIYGAEKSEQKAKNFALIEEFSNQIPILPIFNGIKVFAKEKVKLQKSGRTISDFDLLIGATAIANNMIMVTRNIKEFNRMENIKLENWVE
ncbi:MAG: type II toxin-antitoxin system VapC family toxin [Chlorobi bacterium]|nr:type II toxin-antitoxin system VapC family toxin [Chlorobiota bacterium]